MVAVFTKNCATVIPRCCLLIALWSLVQIIRNKLKPTKGKGGQEETMWKFLSCPNGNYYTHLQLVFYPKVQRVLHPQHGYNINNLKFHIQADVGSFLLEHTVCRKQFAWAVLFVPGNLNTGT
jgi:hypothetical protein